MILFTIPQESTNGKTNSAYKVVLKSEINGIVHVLQIILIRITQNIASESFRVASEVEFIVTSERRPDLDVSVLGYGQFCVIIMIEGHILYITVEYNVIQNFV